MKLKGKKHLIGFINSRSKGGELRQQKHGPVVQSSRVDNDAIQRRLGYMLGAACNAAENPALMLARVKAWADKADDSVLALSAAEVRALEPFWEWAIEEGYMMAPAGPLLKIENMESEDLDTRIKWRTAKLLDRARG